LLNAVQTLYAGTIRFNILLGAIKPHSEVTQEEIDDACRDANILDFINDLPKFVSGALLLPARIDSWIDSGFETEVGGKGSQLSGGQKRMTCPLPLPCGNHLRLLYRTYRHRTRTSAQSQGAPAG
jgi:ATP-binding cassette subfamily B (MDR/TAP) protein 1